MVKLKMPAGFHTFFSRNGNRLHVDKDGCIEVEEMSQEHLDLIGHQGVAVEVFDEFKYPKEDFKPESVDPLGADA